MGLVCGQGAAGGSVWGWWGIIMGVDVDGGEGFLFTVYFYLVFSLFNHCLLLSFNDCPLNVITCYSCLREAP